MRTTGYQYVAMTLFLVANQTLCAYKANSQDSSDKPEVRPDKSSAAESTSENNQKSTDNLDVGQLSDEDRQEILATERFMQMLEKSPRRGTAFDRVYAHHVNYGSLENLLGSLRERIKRNTQDGTAWQLIGLLDVHRGQYEAAAKSLREAERLRAEDPMASYYLGLTLAGTGDLEPAIEALRRAVDRKPGRADQQEIYQQLGRMLLRNQQVEKALEIWDKLESLYPNDPRVTEEIAAVLVQEDKLQLARDRYEKLLKLVRDDFRRSSIKLEIADLTAKLGDTKSGLKQLESILGELNPSSWLFREIRRRIDEILLKTKDQDGLVKYYETWLSAHGDDLDAMTRLARFLASVGRMDEACGWCTKAVGLAPSQVELRKSLIGLLIESRKYEAADKQYQELVRLEPQNVDNFRQWGTMLLQNSSLSEEQRVKSALGAWQKIIDISENDPLTISQVAELCLSNHLIEAAEKYFRLAVEAAPKQNQYQEYLAEFLHRNKRTDEAVAVWQHLTDAADASVDTLKRAADMFGRYGNQDRATAAIDRAVQLDAKDFQIQFQAAKIHFRTRNFENANRHLQIAESLAGDSSMREQVISERISQLQSNKKLPEAITELRKEIADLPEGQRKTPSTAASHYKLARYLEVNRQWAEAMVEISLATEIDPGFIQAWTLAARLAEVTRDHKKSIETLKHLASLDRRSRSTYWTRICELELRDANYQGAMEAAGKLIQAAPTMVSSYEFYAQVCLKANKFDEAVDSMRKAIRIDPKDTNLLLDLAKMMADKLRHQEAIELYFRVMDKSDELEDLLDIVSRLTNIYRLLGDPNQLRERLEAERKLPGLNRSRTICLAQYWQNNNDLKKARQELESLLLPESRDTILINQLAKLCRQAGDLSSAVSYQRRLVAVAPGAETELPLANLLFDMGEANEARTILVAQIMRETDSVRQLASIDTLLQRRDWETADRILSDLLSKQPDDWELLYRHGVAKLRPGLLNYRASRKFEIPEEFKRLLNCELPLDTLSRAAIAELKSGSKRRDNSAALNEVQNRWRDLATIQYVMLQVRAETNIEDFGINRQGPGSNPATVLQPNAFGPNAARSRQQTFPRFQPKTFGEARLATIIFLHELNSEACERLFAELQRSESQSGKIEMFDRLYLSVARQAVDATIEVARQVAEAGGDYEKQLFVQSLQLKYFNPERQMVALGLALPSQSQTQATKRASKSASEENIMTPDQLRQAVQFFLSIAPELKYQSIQANSLGAYGVNSRIPLQVTLTRGTSTRIVASNPFGAFQLYFPMPNFLYDQAKQVGDDLITRQIEQDFLDNSSSAHLIMAAIVQRVERGDTKDLDEMCQRWSKACDTVLQSQSGNPINPAYWQFVTQGMDEFGSAEIYQLVAKLQKQNRSDELSNLIKQTIPVLFEISQKQSASQPLMNRLTNQRASARQYASTDLNNVIASLPRIDMVTSESIVYLTNADARPINLQDFYKKFLEAEQNANLRACWASNLANLQMITKQYPAAIQSLKIATELRPADFGLQMLLSRALVQDKQINESLSVLTKMKTDVPSLANYRDLMVIDLNIELKNKDSAIEKIKELKEQSLATDDQILLHSQMLKVDMKSEAREFAKKFTRVVPRVSTARIRSTTSQNQLQAFEKQQREERLNALKKTLTESTCMLDINEVQNELLSAITEQASFGRASNLPLTSNMGKRKLALFSLARENELAKMMVELEAELKRNPDRVDHLMQMIEYQTCSPGLDPIPNLRTLLKREPTSKSAKFMLATCLELKNSEECYQLYESLLTDHPGWTCEKLLAIESRAFSGKEKQDTWAKALLKVEPQLLKGSVYVINNCKDLLRNEGTSELGLQLFDHLAIGYSGDLGKLLLHFADSTSPTWWENRQFTDRILAMLLPTAKEIELNNLTRSELLTGGLDPSVSQISKNWQAPIEKGLAKLSFEQVLDWKSRLKSHISENPSWLLGPMLLLQTELFLGLDREALEVANNLVRTEAIRLIQDPATVRWFSYRVFQNRGDAVTGEIELLEYWLDHSAVNDRLVFGRLLQICEKSKPSAEIRNVLARRSMAAGAIRWRQIEIAQVQQKLGFSLDVIRNISRLSTGEIRSTAGLQGATESTTSHRESSIRLLNDAFANIGRESKAEVIEPQLFSVNAEGTPELIDLLTLFPSPSGLFAEQLYSPVAEQFMLTAATEHGLLLRDRLSKAVAQPGVPLATRVLELLWVIHQKELSEEQLLLKLDSVLSAISNGQSENIDTNALCLLGIKLYETQPYASSPAVRERIQQISRLIREWMGVTTAVEPQLVVLATLAKLCVKDQVRQAELICDEMLTVLQNSDQSGLRLSGKNPRVPTFSMTQFRQVLAICRFAREHGMSQVQLRALRLALVDRPPRSTSESSSELRMLFRSLENQPPSNEVFELLKEAVFITQPLKQLQFHASIVDRAKGQVESVAESLVDYAVKLNQLDSLIEANKLQANNRISHLSMGVLIDIAKGDNEKAHEKLVDLLAVVRFESGTYEAATILVAARKAFDQPDLRTIARTILSGLGTTLE